MVYSLPGGWQCLVGEVLSYMLEVLICEFVGNTVDFWSCQLMDSYAIESMSGFFFFNLFQVEL